MNSLSKLALVAAGSLLILSNVALAEQKTFNIWWFEGADTSQGIAWTKALDEFKAKHADVTVNFQQKTFQQLQASGSMILNSDQAPDVLEYNKGNATAGLVSSQGLLTNLDDYVTKEGWDKILNAGDLVLSKYDEKGIYGSGHIWGISVYGEYVSCFYNIDMFDKAGLKPPTTMDEWVADMDTFQKQGITPLSLGAIDTSGQHLLASLAYTKADDTWVQNYQGLKAPLDGAPYLYAAQTLLDWVNKGYISKDVTGEKAEDAGTSFISGKYPIFYSGSWWYNRFTTEATSFKWGTFLFPGTTMSPGSAGNMWVVPEKAQNKDLAYKFIDITMSPAIQALMGNSGGVPVAAKTSDITAPSSKLLIDNFNVLTQRDGIGFYPDWPTPTFYDQLNAGLQELVNGTKSVKDVDTELGAEYQAGVNSIVKAP